MDNYVQVKLPAACLVSGEHSQEPRNFSKCGIHVVSYQTAAHVHPIEMPDQVFWERPISQHNKYFVTITTLLPYQEKSSGQDIAAVVFLGES